MKAPLLKIGLLGCVVVTGMPLAGCHRSGAVADTTAAPAPVQVSTPGRKPQGAGGAIDTNDYPAPTGVKTGVEKK